MIKAKHLFRWTSAGVIMATVYLGLFISFIGVGRKEAFLAGFAR